MKLVSRFLCLFSFIYITVSFKIQSIKFHQLGNRVDVFRSIGKALATSLILTNSVFSHPVSAKEYNTDGITFQIPDDFELSPKPLKTVLFHKYNYKSFPHVVILKKKSSMKKKYTSSLKN